jgi:all-trans-retinol dehydrogenase (NAD+)
MSELMGSHVLITGGASGLGRAVARRMAARGARLILWDIQAEALARTAEELLGVGGQQVHTETVDLSDRHAVAEAARRTLDAVGHVDVLINNAGVVSGRSFLELSEEQIERTFAVNTLALFWTTRAFLPGMKERGRGHVVTIASASGWVGVRRLADYAASKWAAVGFDESLRMELRAECPGVQTTCICPFFINTGMFDGVQTRVPWLLPILDEASTAARIVRAVERNEARVMLPPVVALVPVFRFLPVRVFDVVADWLGINATMDHFRGREAAAPAADRVEAPAARAE